MEEHPPVLDPNAMEAVLRSARTIAVLGIKPESRHQLDAHQIPLYLQKVGYTILPVPTRYPEATTILGAQVQRLGNLRAPIDVLSVFVKPADLPPHLDAILKLRPGVVWFQSGLLRPELASPLLRGRLRLAEDCIGCRRASIEPSWTPLSGQTSREGR